jgi:hypothetical protein
MAYSETRAGWSRSSSFLQAASIPLDASPMAARISRSSFANSSDFHFA